MLPIISEDDYTDIIGFKVKSHTSNTWPELNHFTSLDFVESDDTGDTITDADNSSVFFDVILG